MAGFHSRGVLATGLIAVTVLAVATVAAQEQFQFVVSARNAADGTPVTDLKPDEVVMLENGVANKIVKVEPFHVPVKLTIAVDNGILSRNALGHYRSGLEGLVKALPPEIEVGVIATAPQPRFVVQPTLDRTKVFRGLNSFAPEESTPRFTDTIIEFSMRLEKEFNKTKRLDSLPVLLLISTTASENVSYRGQELANALRFLETRRARVFITMLTTLQTTGQAGQQPMIGIPLVKATRGRYEALANSSALTTLLPEYGAAFAALHQPHYNQVLVTAARQDGLKGALQNPRIELTRPNMTGQVSLDGLLTD